jgi:hypothetical protein
MRTEYPWDGRAELTVTTDAPITLTLRVPGWCEPEDVYCLEQTGQPSTWPDASPGPRRHSVTFCRATRKSGN